ncbi:Zn finger-containing GTPase- Activating Protein for ARF [Teratosphaeriaceae sp. CCFEE 6253]|nr:Zn finger-containing GTPase- Activating Protein for ARF [Teratosphaeriaceae sp. CCFEE 6253]
MDALKPPEITRMQLGGNKPWKDFFNAHASNTAAGREFDDCTISERYDSEAGEEWKERLTARVEGREYVQSVAKPRSTGGARNATVESAAQTPSGSGRNTPNPSSRMTSQSQRTASPSQKSSNEAYFARMGSANANRPDDVAPAQGGKYAGFGSAPPPTSSSGAGAGGVPSADDFQKDPVAALTKGFGWLSGAVSKQAATVHKSYIAPGVRSLQDGELAARAQQIASQGLNTVQQGTRGLGEQFSKFVDPDEQRASGAGSARGGVKPEKADFWDSFGQDPNGPPKEKKDFWDDFADAAESKAATQKPPSSIGTSAMKLSGGAGGGGGAAKQGEEAAGWKDW